MSYIFVQFLVYCVVSYDEIKRVCKKSLVCLNIALILISGGRGVFVCVVWFYIHNSTCVEFTPSFMALKLKHVCL